MARTMGQMQATGFRSDAGTIDRDTGAPWVATLRLAVIVSVVAVLAVAALTTVVAVPTNAVVLAVIVVAFAASWVHSGRTVT